jgi:hypothetical protein
MVAEFFTAWKKVVAKIPVLNICFIHKAVFSFTVMSREVWILVAVYKYYCLLLQKAVFSRVCETESEVAANDITKVPLQGVCKLSCTTAILYGLSEHSIVWKNCVDRGVGFYVQATCSVILQRIFWRDDYFKMKIWLGVHISFPYKRPRELRRRIFLRLFQH